MSLNTDLHGMLVHFPIALLFISVPLEALAFHPKLRSLRTAALVTLLLGTLFAWAAYAVGPDENARGVSHLIQYHQLFASLTVGIFSLLSLWRLWMLRKDRPLAGKTAVAYMLLAVIGLGTLGTTGVFGGRMVYTEGIGVSRNGQPVAPPTHGQYRKNNTNTGTNPGN